MRTGSKWLCIAATLAGLLVAGGCGGSDSDDSGGGEASDSGLTSVKVGFTASAPRAPIYVGIEQGFFEDEGLDIETVPLESASVVTAAVDSGEVQIGGGAADGMMLASTQGLSIKVIPPAANSSDPPPHVTNTVLVGPDSPIRTAKDLEGKTISVVSLHGLFELGLRGTAAQEDVDVDATTFKYRALPFAEGLQAALSGSVDAVAEVEPYITAGKEQGARAVLDIYPLDPDEYSEWQTGAWFTSTSYLEENPDIVERFSRAMAKANDYSNKHPEAVRAAIPEFTEVEPEVAEKIVLGRFPTDIDIEQWQTIADMQAEFGLSDEPADIEDLVVTFDELKEASG